MKKSLLSIALLMGVSSSFADEAKLRISNLTFNDEFTEVSCMDEACEALKFVTHTTKADREYLVKKETLDKIEDRRTYRETDRYEPYEITRTSFDKTVKQHIDGGYYLEAAGGVIGRGVTIALDTALSPFSAISYIVMPNAVDKPHERRDARKILNHLESAQEMILKDKWYKRIVRFLNNKTIEITKTENQALITSALNGAYENCKIETRIDHIGPDVKTYQYGTDTHYLYVNGMNVGYFINGLLSTNSNGRKVGFSGYKNYQIDKALEKLETEGICKKN